MQQLAIVIPTLEPTTKFLDLLATIRQKQQDPAPIIVINDGSSADYQMFFEKAAHQYDAIVLEHPKNLGKGRALKTAFSHILEQLPAVQGAITIDSDGQHTYEDMLAVGRKFLENPETLVLGVRHFTNEVPVKSRLGNILTRNVLKLTTGIDLTDTQTGLRVIPRNFLKALLHSDGERFEYELNMLIDAKRNNVSMIEVPIETIYYNDNEGTHFRAISDSLLIYRVILKNVLSRK